jgi:hypothetical protein
VPVAAKRRSQQAVFTLAAVAFVAHLVDTVLADTMPLTLELDAALVSGGVALAIAGLYSRIAPLPRAGFAVLLGAPWLYGCLHYHVIPTLERGPAATDVSGIVAAVASVALLVIGVPPLVQAIWQSARPHGGPEVPGHP